MEQKFPLRKFYKLRLVRLISAHFRSYQNAWRFTVAVNTAMRRLPRGGISHAASVDGWMVWLVRNWVLTMPYKMTWYHGWGLYIYESPGWSEGKRKDVHLVPITSWSYSLYHVERVRDSEARWKSRLLLPLLQRLFGGGGGKASGREWGGGGLGGQKISLPPRIHWNAMKFRCMLLFFWQKNRLKQFQKTFCEASWIKKIFSLQVTLKIRN